MVPRILTHDQKRRLHISSDLLRSAELFDRVITPDKTWCFQCDSETKWQSMQRKTQNSPRPKKITHVSVAGQYHACVFLRSQEDSSLWIHCTRTNGKSTVLFGSAEKVTGISNVYWTVHHCNSWGIKNQLDVTCYFISLIMPFDVLVFTSHQTHHYTPLKVH